MPKYKIADFIVEYEPKYTPFKMLSTEFLYNGEREADFRLNVTDERLTELHKKMVEGTELEDCEEFAYAMEFFRVVVRRDAMLLHSSAFIFDGRAYLFSAQSQVGKSTHTRLWKELYGDSVVYINDDKPVIKLNDGSAPMVYGTPFDGGSGIANNLSAPLGGIIFLERGEENEIIKLSSTAKILHNLYFATTHMLNRSSADLMLRNFEKLINSTDFYLLKCNMSLDAAKMAHDFLIK